jgi:hypothetical protein
MPGVVGELLGEYIQGTRDEAYDSIRVTTGAASLDLRSPADGALSRLGRRSAGGELLDRTGYRPQTVHAGPALTGALSRQPTCDT